MNKILLLILSLIVLSCSEKVGGDDLEKRYTQDTFLISVKATDNMEQKYLLLENFPTEGGPVITKDPSYATVSEIEYSDGIYYVYKPIDGFTGTDRVEITNNISAGGKEIIAQDILQLTIEVSE